MPPASSTAAEVNHPDLDRLPAWGHAWRLVFVWCAGALVWLFSAAIVANAWGLAEGAQPSPSAPALLFVDFVVGQIAVVAVAFRRRWPMTIALVTALLSGISMFASAAALLALTSVATRRHLPSILLVSGVGCAVSLFYETVMTPVLGLRGTAPDSGLLVDLAISFGFIGLVYLVAVLLGWNTGSRRELVRSWRTQARTATSEQAARVAQARLAERARIAREMHDVLAHRLSLVAMHAGVLAHRADLPEEDRRAAAEVVRSGAHQALEELREVLGVLREDGDPERTVEAPQPGLSAIPSLVAELTSSGQDVTLTADPALWARSVSLPASTGRHAYRVVQESLTNARKHAPGVTCAVTLGGGPGHGLTLEISNPLTRVRDALPSGGRGLPGMAERVALAGGRFDARVRGAAFIVRVWLPWPSRQHDAPEDAPVPARENGPAGGHGAQQPDAGPVVSTTTSEAETTSRADRAEGGR
ncbi:signal transduction histidine kinase [Kineosphaera limosa]|uniref:histidine kinase n=1 Tax=Kineosphaera limosa NBRC 100340 TaxID=1184609 RepID=K6VHA5_9MICO|nr:histidine kinase [Kineosphaera limosa]NYD99875.1 signal transduction histidine kinase [Kineosphaera limosa]GAB95588.1 putative two-component histidine kinase [Kineosphaera limosa NBRC 100340]